LESLLKILVFKEKLNQKSLNNLDNLMQTPKSVKLGYKTDECNAKSKFFNYSKQKNVKND